MRSSNPLIRKTSRQIWLFSTAIVFIALVAFGTVFTWVYQSTLYDATDEQLLEQVMLLSKRPDKFKPIKEGTELHPPNNKNVILQGFEDSKLIYTNPNPFFQMDENIPLNYEEPIYIRSFTYDGYHFRGLVVQTDGGAKTYKIATNVDGLIQSVSNLREALLISSIGLVGIASALGFVLSKRIMVPIEKNYEEQVRFVQDASHEMRTPLAVLQGRLELIAKSQGDSVHDHLMSLSQMMAEIRSLERLNSDLLQLSKMDLTTDLCTVSKPLSSELEDLLDYYNDLAEIREKVFLGHIHQPELEVTWDFAKVKRMIHILTENAFKYTGEDGKIELDIFSKNGKVEIVVKDNGIGIKKEDLPMIFERFYRSPAVRATDIEGSGIGLSLLKAISEKTGATLHFDSAEGEGTTVTITLPLQMKSGFFTKKRAHEV